MVKVKTKLEKQSDSYIESRLTAGGLGWRGAWGMKCLSKKEKNRTKKKEKKNKVKFDHIIYLFAFM